MSLYGEKIGIAFGCYAPMHQGHLDLIFKAKKECDAGVIIIVCGSDNDRGVSYNMPLIKRFEYIKEFFKDDDLVKVHMIDERLSTMEATNYLLTADVSRKKRKQVVDGVAASIILDTYLKMKGNK